VQRKRVLVISAACALVGAVVLIAWPGGPKEPEYERKRLSEWGAIYNMQPNRRDEAERALQHIGTNALPFLVAWVGCETGEWKVGPGKLMERGPSWCQYIGRTFFYPEEVRAFQNIGTFRAMPRHGAAAIPALAYKLEHARHAWTKTRLIMVLEAMSSEEVNISAAVPALLGAGPIGLGRPANTLLVDRLGGNRFVIWGLTNALHHPDVAIRRKATTELCSWCDRHGGYPELLRPALLDTDAEVRSNATVTLKRVEPLQAPAGR
jgi:hypothetical protein